MVQHEINLPEGWVLKQIKDVAPLQRGFDLPASKVVSGKYPVCYSNGIANYHNEFKAEGPGVFTGRSGTIGNVFYVKENYWPHNTSLWVTDFKGNDRKFVYYLYQQVKLDRFNAGTGVPTLNRNDVHVHKIPIPKSAVEQQKIASILSTWDKAIELKEKLIEQKKEQKKGLMQKLLTGEVRFPGYDGKWQKVDFEEVFIRIPVKKYQIKTTEYLKSGQFPVIDQGKQKIVAYSNNAEKVYQVESKGVIVFGDHTRERKFIDFDFIVGADGTQVLDTNDGYNNKFYFYCLLHQNIPNTGYNRHFKFLKEMWFFKPSLNEQVKIAEILSKIDKEIDLINKELEELKHQKQGLMQQLLTGKIRVKV